MSFWSNLIHKKTHSSDMNSPAEIQNSVTDEEPGEDFEQESDFRIFDDNKVGNDFSISEDEEEHEVVEREIHPAKIICPDCGGITLEGLEFCDKCGGELQ